MANDLSNQTDTAESDPERSRSLEATVGLLVQTARERLALSRSQQGCAGENHEFEMSDHNQGDVIAGRYQICELLGEGGWGVVYRALDLQDNIDVAVKLLHRHMALQPEVRKRFQREVEAVSGLCHPNIVSVLDFGQCDDGPYMVMEFLNGVPLSFLVETEGPFCVEDALPIFIDACKALAHAHERGVIHRDLKPSNLMLVHNEDGTVQTKLLDFGLSKPMNGGEVDKKLTRLTATGMVFGTPFYMSPEQARGLEVDTRTDVYSFGCTMFETVTGQPPFCGQEPIVILTKHMQEMPRGFERIRSRQSHVRERMEFVLLKTLAKEKQGRQQSFVELGESLLAIHTNSSDLPGAANRATSMFRLLRQRIATFASVTYANRAARLFHVCAVLLVLLTGILIAMTLPDNGQLEELTGRWESLDTSPKRTAAPDSFNGGLGQIAGGLAQIGLRNEHDPEQLANAARVVAQSLVAKQQYSKAEEYFRQSLRNREVAVGPISVEGANTAMELGDCLLHENKLRDAQFSFESALSQQQALSNNSQDEYAPTYLKLAQIGLKLDQTEKAIPYLHSLLACTKEKPLLAMAHSCLGDSYTLSKVSHQKVAAAEEFAQARSLWHDTAFKVNEAISAAELANSLVSLTLAQRNEVAALKGLDTEPAASYRQALEILKEHASDHGELARIIRRYFIAYLWGQNRFIDAFKEQQELRKANT